MTHHHRRVAPLDVDRRAQQVRIRQPDLGAGEVGRQHIGGTMINDRDAPTQRVRGGYYRSRRLVRVYSHDSVEGRRPVEELFDTFLHEVAHHLEYTEPSTFGSPGCRRVPGLMHSRLFWRILGELKWRWGELKAGRTF